MAGALGNGPREALGEEVDFVRLSKRKSVDEASVSKVARVVTEVEAAIGSKGAIVSEAAIGSKGVIVSEAAIGYEGAIVSEAIGSEAHCIFKKHLEGELTKCSSLVWFDFSKSCWGQLPVKIAQKYLILCNYW